MKNKLRRITVGDEIFVYWFSWGSNLQIFISPQNNKKCKVTLCFNVEQPAEESQHFWRYYSLDAFKDGVAEKIKLVEPRFIAKIITHILNTSDILNNAKETIIHSTWEILSDMGYTHVTPIWIQEF